MSQSPELKLVEDPLVKDLVNLGWKFVDPDDLEREDFHDPLLLPILSRVIRRVNADHEITDEEIKDVLNELRLIPSGAEGSKKILQYLKDGVPVKFKRDRVVRYVRLFDYELPSNNDFIVSRQVNHEAGERRIRNDIILYVNGIPLVNIECKNPANPTEDWYTAYRQIKEYEKTIPELYKYVQIGVAVHFAVKYFPIVPWQEEVRCYEWRGETKDPLKDLLEMLKPEVLLELVRNYLFYRVEMGRSTKVIARYMQFRASEKVCRRAIEYALGRSDKNKGLIWHWQGSGKTLTMIFAANKLYRSKEMENPTIFLIVDREELERQHYAEFNALDIFKPEVVDSIESLKNILSHDCGRGKRGIFLTLVHKFRPEELYQLQNEFLSAQDLTILKRKNVVVLVDEAHRTQYGVLAGQMRGILKMASYFAFTGTPISKVGKDTYIEFSYPEEEKYLDKYFIVDAINDGFTVKIAYQPRLEKEVHLNKDLLDYYLGQVFDDLYDEYREKIDEKVKERLNAITVFLKNPSRIEKIAKDVAEHFRSEVEGRYKAMVVAVNREACVLYKRALDNLLPKEWSEVVMTYNRNDPEPIRLYQEELKQRFPGKDYEEITDEIIGRFKEEENPKILIVTDMLLTGFDAPILQTMYLDKPLKEHRLLQAIARTNRPYNDMKEVGMVLDYVGIFREVEKAFAIYSSEEINGAIRNLMDLKRVFERLVSEAV
ncbi:MAG: HsdR family type I site-specific deoxyribonuclease [Candidatus Bathyarchaeia archaeon]